MDTLLAQACEKGARQERLSRDEALAVASSLGPDQLHAVGRAALDNRRRRFGDQATYVCNLHVNPSNICTGGCGFCRYAAQPGDDHAYVLSEEEIFQRLAAHAPSEVHIVGGMNDIWDFERNIQLVRTIRQAYPAIYIKGYTAVEIDWFARCAGVASAAILDQLAAAGLDALPGGGAELFSPRVRAELCPDKLAADGWLAIHRQAHARGLTTNATMLYGLGESPAERVDHLLALRAAQDESGGFRCFIPLAYQDGGGPGGAGGATVRDALAVVALARLVLDNFPHIKAYWPMIGLETAAVALSFGADDLDGTVGDERIAHAAGARSPSAVARETMAETISLGGFTPVERLGNFALRGGEG